MPETIYLATEDVLSEAILKRILFDKFRHTEICTNLPKPQANLGGFGAIKRNLSKYVSAAKNDVYHIILTDLDKYACAPSLLNDWKVDQPLPDKLLFRIAVREVESWLLADRENIANYLQVASARVQRNPEELDDPKGHLISLASSSRSRKIREGMCPIRGNYSPMGPDYNPILCNFVMANWDYSTAAINAPSLQRMLNRIDEVTHLW